MNNESIKKVQSDKEALTRAVEKLHGVKAIFIDSSPVHEEMDGKTVWKGTVSLFDLTDHPTAKKCFAWSVPPTSSTKEKFYAVLMTPQIDTPEKAVRASIIADHKNKI